MTQGPEGLVIHLSVDQPATLDLLRRHGDALTADLRQAGFAGTTLTFSGGGGGGGDGASRDDAPSSPPSALRPEDTRPVVYAPSGPSSSGTLDLRL